MRRSKKACRCRYRYRYRNRCMANRVPMRLREVVYLCVLVDVRYVMPHLDKEVRALDLIASRRES